MSCSIASPDTRSRYGGRSRKSCWCFHRRMSAHQYARRAKAHKTFFSSAFCLRKSVLSDGIDPVGCTDLRAQMLTRTLPAGFPEPCLPTRAGNPPRGSQWVHEIKWDGYRMMARRRDGRVQLFTRRGYDWTHRFPWIVWAFSALQIHSAII